MNPKIQSGRTMSNLDSYCQRVQGILFQIISDNKYGITSNKLYEILSAKLGTKFEFSLFNCSNFNDFVSTYAEPFSDIMLKQGQYFLYPKNSQNHFMPV